MAQQGDASVLEEANSLMVQGKRFMALEDFQSATDCLEQACQLFDAFYGVAKRECADAYLEYGLALVALANLEAGSGTDRLIKKAGIEEEEEEEGVDDEEYDEEEEGGEEDGEEATKNKNGLDEKPEMKEDETDSSKTSAPTQATENGTVNGQSSTEGHSDDKTTNGSAMDQDIPAPQASSSSATPKPATSNTLGGDTESQDDEATDNEEATTIEIAWEVLCLAKRLYMTDESLDGRLKLAETLQKIGEISIEWDNNDNAVSILEECLKIRTAILEPNDRLIALTYYNLGLAHSFKSDTLSANDNFQNAINVIERRIASLSEDLEKAKVAQDTVAVGSYEKEINELKELLPDMTMRLDDSKEDGTKSTEAIKRTRDEMQQEDEEARKVCSDKSKPVDDISHLVKRKAT